MIYCETNQACPEAWECRPCAEGMTGCSAEESVCAPIFDDVCGEDGGSSAECCGNGKREAWELCDEGSANTDVYSAGKRRNTNVRLRYTVVIALCLMARPVMTAR